MASDEEKKKKRNEVPPAEKYVLPDVTEGKVYQKQRFNYHEYHPTPPFE